MVWTGKEEETVVEPALKGTENILGDCTQLASCLSATRQAAMNSALYAHCYAQPCMGS
jgi:hypothetical protein